MIKKDCLKVGATQMFCATIPVNIIFDEVYNPSSALTGMIAERFQLLEIDGFKKS